MKNLLTLGCSHSSINWGKSWPDYISANMNMNLIRASSCGAGNGFFIEKLNLIIQTHDIDLVIVQLTEPTRVVLGFSSFENLHTDSDGYNHPNTLHDLGCYTWNSHDNETNLEKLHNSKCIIDDLWFKEISISNWINYKVCEDICTMKFICDSHNIPVIFWSWFVPFENLFVKNYNWLKCKINWIPNCAQNFLKTNDIDSDPNLGGHYGEQVHSFLVKEWLLNKIKTVV